MFPFYQIEKWHICVNCLGVVSLVSRLMFHNILMKLLIKDYMMFVLVTLAFLTV